MAQAMIEQRKKNAFSQTGSDDGQIFYLTNNKNIRLYFSTVYKERVLSFNLSSSKSFILNKQSWRKFRKLIPLIEDFFDNGVSD